MNEFQTNMYNGLMDLCKNIKVFFYRDFETSDPNMVNRLFTYQLAGFMNFAEPYAMDARGTMFAVNKETGEPLKMLSLPMQKFFSIGEGDQKELEIGVKDAVRAFIKEDGTLINPYIDVLSGELLFKSSKSSEYIRSDLVKKSMTEKALLETADLFRKGFCCNFELTTPENIVKINNKEYRCHLLMIRSMLNGKTLAIREEAFKKEYPELAKILIKEIPVSEVDINSKEKEGYVIELADGRFKKVKTLPYLSMVSCLNNQEYSNRKKIANIYYKAFALEMGDEIRHLLNYKNKSENFNIEEKMAYCDLVEKVVQETYLPMMEQINRIFEENKDQGRAALAKAAGSVNGRLVNAVLSLHLGREYDFAGLAADLYSGEIAKKEVYTPPVKSEFKKPKSRFK